jgi:hypothetical protein
MSSNTRKTASDTDVMILGPLTVILVALGVLAFQM